MAIAIVAAIVLAVALLRLFMVTPPEKLAAFLRRALPIALIATGIGLTVLGRGAIGLPLAAFGFAAYRRLRSASPIKTGGSAQTSTVRGRYLEMVLDHESGDLDGLVLQGSVAGARLSELPDARLTDLWREVADDPDSLRLLEAYLDRRLPTWRDHVQAQGGGGLGGAPGTGAMTEKQAYEILGLQPGATVAEVREAHRRLMKRVHPDQGGTDFLAARINEAKAFLVDRHH